MIAYINHSLKKTLFRLVLAFVLHHPPDSRLSPWQDNHQKRTRKGTEITVKLDLPSQDMSREKTGDATSLTKNMTECARQRTKGLRVSLLNTGQNFSMDTEFVKALIKTFRDWFDIDVGECSDMKNVDTDFFLFAEPPPISMLLQQHNDSSSDAQKSREVPLIICCTNALDTAILKSAGVDRMVQLGRIIEIISQP